MGEILFLFVLALIVIGPKQLPELARTLGRLLNELKRSTEGFTDDLKRQARIDEPPRLPPVPPVAPVRTTQGEVPPAHPDEGTKS